MTNRCKPCLCFRWEFDAGKGGIVSKAGEGRPYIHEGRPGVAPFCPQQEEADGYMCVCVDAWTRIYRFFQLLYQPKQVRQSRCQGTCNNVRARCAFQRYHIRMRPAHTSMACMQFERDIADKWCITGADVDEFIEKKRRTFLCGRMHIHATDIPM